jgi:hypothetical protein
MQSKNKATTPEMSVEKGIFLKVIYTDMNSKRFKKSKPKHF